jgi:4-methyl-5(b-hydroxyethyl)-thiazole monophosphate biosynthesis
MVYVILADGFEEIEALTPVDVLRRSNVDVKTASISGEQVHGAHGVVVTADVPISAVKEDEIEAIVLPGGLPGATNLDKNKRVRELVTYTVKNNIPTCAICAGPMVIGNLGFLEGKNAICYPGFENYLKGAKISRDPVCTDGNIITAKGPGVAYEFAFAILAKLKGARAVEEIKDGLQYQR